MKKKLTKEEKDKKRLRDALKPKVLVPPNRVEPNKKHKQNKRACRKKVVYED